ncbi:MAG TPA: acyl carrier protein [Reyranella sp.]|jgi:acyl carrier protein|nr:acyl carrier protein [Reyranella sp.]
MLSRDEVYRRLARYLTDMFEVPAEKIRPEARLYEELDLDSIDALDLVVKLQEITGRRISPQEFKTVRTVGDVVDRVTALLHA